MSASGVGVVTGTRNPPVSLRPTDSFHGNTTRKIESTAFKVYIWGRKKGAAGVGEGRTIGVEKAKHREFERRTRGGRETEKRDEVQIKGTSLGRCNNWYDLFAVWKPFVAPQLPLWNILPRAKGGKMWKLSFHNKKLENNVCINDRERVAKVFISHPNHTPLALGSVETFKPSNSLLNYMIWIIEWLIYVYADERIWLKLCAVIEDCKINNFPRL